MAKQKIKVIREEMLQVANNVAQEKNINQDDVFSAMEQALEKSARVKYGMERDIRVNINRENGDIELKNSIVWNNTSGGNNFGSLDGTGGIELTYSDIEGGFEGEGNIDLDPLFKDAENGDFTLADNSPCIDAGISDLDSDGVEDINDYNGLSPDMGAFETVIAGVNGFSIYNTPTNIILSWEAIENNSFLYYLLERSTNEEFSENLESYYLNINYYDDDDVDYEIDYFYRISYYADGWSEFSETLTISLEWLSLDQNKEIPREFSLLQNYPNPFNPSTNFGYYLKEDSFVNITVYNIKGNKIITLINQHQLAGVQSVKWNSKNSQGRSVSPGVYIYTIKTKTFSDSKKILNKYSMGLAHQKVIHLLSTYEGISISELLKKLKVTKQSLNRVLKDLIKMEIITFEKDDQDTRVKHVFLNTKGKKIFDEIFEIQKKRIYNALLNSSSEEVINFDNVLKKIING